MPPSVCSTTRRWWSTSTTPSMAKAARLANWTTRRCSPRATRSSPGNGRDEWQAISLNYTSGTTGNPKGVVYHHRGAYLNALGNQMTWSMGQHPVYLWTLPMFHCNGWCYPWTVTALAGVHVCLRRVDPQKVLTLIREHQVSHLCGAPIVLNALINMPDSAKAAIDHPVHAMVAGAAPPAKVIGAVEEMGIRVTHVYGLTEVYGPVTVCAWHGEWDDLPLERRAAIKSRQGVRYPTLEGVMVADPKTLEPVPRDGQSIGEIFMRGNTVMKGYLKNPSATEEAFAGGWFHTGDLAVCHPDGYIEIRDRLKDIIISGGENISTIEWRACSTATRRCWRRRWWRGPTKVGKRPVRSLP